MFVAGLFFSLLGDCSAQEAQGGARIAETSGNVEKVLSALAELPPLPAKATPKAGMFYTFQNREAWPPLPANVLGLPFWNIAT